MQIHIGQILTCKNGEKVKITYVAEDTITIEYEGKQFERPKSIIGKKLFLSDESGGEDKTKQCFSERHRRLSAYSRGEAPYINEHFEERAKEERKRRGKWR